MDSRTIRILTFSLLMTTLVVMCLMYAVPEKGYERTIPLPEQEILSDENGSIIPYTYDGFDDLKVDYSFRGINYTTWVMDHTTRQIRPGRYPLHIAKDGDTHLFASMPYVVDENFGNPELFSFQFYIDQSTSGFRRYSISFVRGVCNGERFHYKTNSSDDIFYEKFGYSESCQIVPGKAIITYEPNKGEFAFLGVVIIGIFLLLYLAFDNRYFH